jgi:hypothetical protein
LLLGSICLEYFLVLFFFQAVHAFANEVSFLQATYSLSLFLNPLYQYVYYTIENINIQNCHRKVYTNFYHSVVIVMFESLIILICLSSILEIFILFYVFLVVFVFYCV